MSLINAPEALERFDNDVEIYIELIDTFLDLNPIDFEEIIQDLTTGQEDEARHRIHQLKGAALTLGADSLAQSAAALEAMLRNKTGGDALLLLDQIKTFYRGSVEELTAIRVDLRKPR